MSTGVPGGRGAAARRAGVILVVVSAGIAVLAFVPGPPAVTVLRGGVALLFLAAGVLTLGAGRLIESSEEAARILSGALSGHAEPGFAPGDLLAGARAAAMRLDRCRAERIAAATEAARLQETRVAMLTEAHRDLLAHHRFTKKMLQAPRTEDVFVTLLQGVRDGLGFPGAMLGTKEDDGDIVFGVVNDQGGRGTVRIPCADADSVLARSLWHGTNTMIRTLGEETHSESDRLVVGDGSAFVVPVIRMHDRKCPERKDCDENECPSYRSDAVRCWLEGPPVCREGHFPTPDEKRRECARCDMFGGRALLVVRGRPDSRLVSPETTGSIVTLANEASLALEIVSLYENTRKMSVTDGLTGLVNHREFYMALRRELDRARRYHHTVSLLMIDLDDFKRYNDEYGHLAGDAALRKVASILRDCVRATDIVARYGGEEFGVIIPETTPGGALMMAERIKTAIGAHDFRLGEAGGVRLTVSIGIYSSEGGLVSEDEFVGFADEAAYHAKTSGKNKVVVKANA